MERTESAFFVMVLLVTSWIIGTWFLRPDPFIVYLFLVPVMISVGMFPYTLFIDEPETMKKASVYRLHLIPLIYVAVLTPTLLVLHLSPSTIVMLTALWSFQIPFNIPLIHHWRNPES